MSVIALDASTVDRANVNVSHPAMTRQTTVSARIHAGERSRSRSSFAPSFREAASVLTSPPTTGFASLASVKIEATAIAPAPMNRTCERQIVIVCAASSTPAAGGVIDVSSGTAIAHAMMRPVSIARPTESPTRWPAPTSASDHAML